MSYRGGQVFSYPCIGGMDRSVAEGAAEPGASLRTVINARMGSRGEWRKRDGYTALATSADANYPNPSGAVLAIGVRGDSEVWATTPTQIGTWNVAANRWVQRAGAYNNQALVPPRYACLGTQQIAGNAVANMESPDVAIGGGVELAIWRDAGANTLMVAAYEDVTGAVIMPPTPYPSTGSMRARVVFGTTVFCIIAWDGSGNVNGITITPANVRARSFGALSTLATDLSTTYQQVDVTASGYGGTERFVIAYPSVLGFSVRAVSSAGAVAYSSLYTAATHRGVSVTSTYGEDRVWAFCSDTATGTAPRYWTGLQSDSFATATTGTLFTPVDGVSRSGCCRAVPGSDASAAYVVWQSAMSAGASTHPYGALRFHRVYYNGGVGYYSPAILNGAAMASQPWLDNASRIACLVDLTVYTTPVANASAFDPWHATALVELAVDSTADQSGGASVDIAKQPHLKLMQGRVIDSPVQLVPPMTYWGAPKVATSDGNGYRRTAATHCRVDGGSYTWDTWGVMVLRFLEVGGARGEHIGTPVGGLSLLTGGCQPYLWDGAQLTEVGFSFPPVIYTATTATSGGFMPDGSWQYAVTYEYVDGEGNIHESAPTFSSVVTHASGTGTNKVTLTVSTLKLTAKTTQSTRARTTSVVLYRTKTGPSAVWYRTIQATGAQNNDPEVDTVTFVDTLADNGLDVATLYALPAGGELANEMPPPLRHAVVVAGRVAAIDAERTDRIVFSKPLRQGRGLAFSSVLEQFVRGIGRLTALAEMDGTLYAFGVSGVAVAAYGEGQDATGAGTWPQPQIISTTAGCIGPHALARTSAGVLFGQVGPLDGADTLLAYSSEPRIWLLPRGGGEPVDVGAKIQGILSGTEPINRFGVELFSADPGEGYRMRFRAACDWPDMQRAVFAVQGTASIILEYDYGNPGADGLGQWSVTALDAFDPRLSSVLAMATAFGGHWLGFGGNIVTLAASDYTTHADTPVFGSSQEPVRAYWETHEHSPDGQAPPGRLREVSLEYRTDETTEDPRMTLGVCMVDGATEVAGHWLTTTWNPETTASPMMATFQPATRRDSTVGAGPRVAWGTAAPGEVSPPDDSADLPPLSVSLEYIPRPGAARGIAANRR
jgi:hypothetical protein